MSAPQTEVLVFVEGQEVARHVLGIGAHVFGSAEDCQVRIASPHISRHHARLSIRENGALFVEDLGSTNGTFLDGVKIAALTPVAPNQSIEIGNVTLLVQQHAISTGASNGDGTPPELAATRRYEPGPEIAKGGMGAVHSARQPGIRREVAMKVMLRDRSPHDRLRFIEEAQITGQLEHPNIVPVHELAVNERGQPYYTMKLVQGRTLRDILKLLAQGDPATVAKHSLTALLTIFQKVCDAVAFAHAKGVIHRDLKPANIMVGDYGEVLVMDWGLAKVMRNAECCRPSVPDGIPATASGTDALQHSAVAPIVTIRNDQEDTFATFDGAVMGTPQYMSPEQARGEVATLDERSDLFTLGAILYEIVTLSPPFRGKTSREILSNILSGHLDTPNARLRAAALKQRRHLPDAGIPESLEAVILKALTHESDQRYQRVTEFQADLTAYQGGFATSAENAGAWRQFKLFVSRHRGISFAVAASLLLITGITAAFTAKVVAESNRTILERNRAQTAEQAAVAERNRAQAAEQTAVEERNQTIAEHNRAQTAEQATATQAEKRQILLEEAARSDRLVAKEKLQAGDQPGALAHFARACTYHPSSTLAAENAVAALSEWSNPLPLFVLPGLTSLGHSVQFSADGTRIVTASGDHTARVWEAASGKLLATLSGHPSYVHSVQFSADGLRIVTASDDTARVWEAASGELLATLSGHTDRVKSAQFSRDGTRIVTASNDRTARVWEAASGKLLATFSGHTMRVESAQFDPLRLRIVTASLDNTARVWEVYTGKLLAILSGHTSFVNSAQFDKDGYLVVTASADHTARVWVGHTGKLVATLSGHTDMVTSAQFSADGARIVTTSFDHTARVWQTVGGKLLATLSGHTDVVNSAAFSRDGSLVVTASSDQTARVWEAASGRCLATLADHTGAVESAEFSADGTRIVTASFDHTARVWATLSGHTDSVVVNSAALGSGGSRSATASGDHTARVWTILPPNAGAPPEWFVDFLHYVAREQLNANGELVAISSTDCLALREKLRVVLRAEAGKKTPYLEVLRRFVSE